jgi:hypothetical protein
MRCLSLLALCGALSGCASVADAAGCPSGQAPTRTAQLFFGRNVGPADQVSDADFRRFVDDELTPRFPDGLTVLEGGGQWRGGENQLVRESSKIVILVLPRRNDATTKINAVRDAYKRRFKQDSVLLVTTTTCASF